MGSKGRIVLPPAAREALDADEGDELVAVIRDREVVLMSRDAARALVRAAFAEHANPVDELLAERKQEARADAVTA